MAVKSLSVQEKIMPFAATWMDQEIIILSEGSQEEKDILFICGT